MKLNVSQEQTALRQMNLRELRARFAAVFGEATPASNRGWLVKRILWRMQALAEGDLPERARQRAAELANDADLRVIPPPTRPPKPQSASASVSRPRMTAAAMERPREGLPIAGSVINRVYKGETLQVEVLADGFAFQGKKYASLSAVAQAVTGSHWNGRLFFGLKGKESGR